MKKYNNITKWMVRILVWIPVIVIACSIFGFSSQQGEESSGLSERAAKVFLHVADEVHIVTLTPDNEATYIENLQTPIRKTAHMTEYMIFTFSLLAALWVWGVRNRKLYVLAFLLVVLFASSDEIHQLFVPGRSGRATDVLIDSVGSMIGLFLVHLTVGKRKKRAAAEKETDKKGW